MNAYSYLVEQGISGNPEELPAEELHNQAWNIVQPLFEQDQRERARQYHHLKGTKRASSQLEGVVRAAYYGQVESLFVALGLQQWGSFDRDTGEARLHEEREPDDQDLSDFAALHTLLNGGTVYAVEQEEMPDPKPLAAIFRY